MKKTTAALLALVTAFSVLAQPEVKGDAQNLNDAADKLKTIKDTTTKHWKTGGIITLSGQEVSLSNWAAGGQSAISAGGLVSIFSNYHTENIIWENNMNLAYGVIKQGTNKNWWKNDDRIQLTSVFGKRAYKSIFYSALLDFKSQFAPGYNYPNDSTKISNFLAPAYVVASLGLDFKPAPYISFFVGPITERLTIVNDDTLAKQGAYGVQADVRDPVTGQITQHYQRTRNQFGGYFKMKFQKNVMENVSLNTTLELFSDYLNHPENLYVNWTTLTSMKINKFLTATFSTQLIYDPAVKIKQADGTLQGPRVQFKQVLGIGFAYKFGAGKNS